VSGSRHSSGTCTDRFLGRNLTQIEVQGQSRKFCRHDPTLTFGIFSSPLPFHGGAKPDLGTYEGTGSYPSRSQTRIGKWSLLWCASLVVGPDLCWSTAFDRLFGQGFQHGKQFFNTFYRLGLNFPGLQPPAGASASSCGWFRSTQTGMESYYFPIVGGLSYNIFLAVPSLIRTCS